MAIIKPSIRDIPTGLGPAMTGWCQDVKQAFERLLDGDTS